MVVAYFSAQGFVVTLIHIPTSTGDRLWLYYPSSARFSYLYEKQISYHLMSESVRLSGLVDKLLISIRVLTMAKLFL